MENKVKKKFRVVEKFDAIVDNFCNKLVIDCRIKQRGIT